MSQPPASQPYLSALATAMRAAANPDNAEPMASYMRDQFPFLGIKSPERKALLKAFQAEHGRPEIPDLPQIARTLWHLPEREFHYMALELLGQPKKKTPSSFIKLYEELILTKSWWDTVDALSSPLVASLFKLHPDILPPTIERWRRSDNFWLRRVTLIFQRTYKDATDEALLFALVRENLGSDEFFINKGIGWALRSYAKVNPERTRHFIEETALSPLSRREAMKGLPSSS